MNLSKANSELAPLQTFDPSAFVGDSQVPQPVCNFVLALAVIYNDCKDGLFSNSLLANSKPGREPKKSQLWGAYNGIRYHYLRLHLGLIHELLQLISDNQDVLRHPFFNSVLRMQPPHARNSWQSLVDVSIKRGTSSPFNKILLMTRNKVSFHYDPKEIYKGYQKHFFNAGKPIDQAFISRGNSMNSSRLYFADAAVGGHFQLQFGSTDSSELINHLADVTENLNQAIMQIVDRFILKRGHAYREYRGIGVREGLTDRKDEIVK